MCYRSVYPECSNLDQIHYTVFRGIKYITCLLNIQYILFDKKEINSIDVYHQARTLCCCVFCVWSLIKCLVLVQLVKWIESYCFRHVFYNFNYLRCNHILREKKIKKISTVLLKLKTVVSLRHAHIIKL